MYKKKLGSIVGILLCGIVLLSGCKPMHEEEKVVEQEWSLLLDSLKETAPNKVDDHIVCEITDKFHIDADVILPDEMDSYEAGKLTMYRHLFEESDRERMAEILAEECGWTDSDMWKLETRESDDVLENGEYQTISASTADGDGGIIIRDTMLTATNYDFYAQYWSWGLGLYGDTIGTQEYDYMSWMLETEELDFATAEESNQKAKDLMEKIGVEAVCESIVYNCTQEEVQRAANAVIADYEAVGLLEHGVEPLVEKEDEAYVVQLQQGAEGIPLFPYELSSNVTKGVFLTGSQSYAVYSARGLEEFRLQSVYDIASIGEKQAIISLADILEQHYQKQEVNTVIKEKVVRVQLYYLAVCVNGDTLEFEGIPVWCIMSDVSSSAGSGREERRTVVYDAYTGEELLW